MKVVVDTNVLVSGLLNPRGTPGMIVKMASSGELEICYDVRILSEYRDVLSRPEFPFDPFEIEELLEQIKAKGYVPAVSPIEEKLPDPDDEIFLEVARGAKAKFLITGNLKHYPDAYRGGILVIQPQEFLQIYRKSLGRSV